MSISVCRDDSVFNDDFRHLGAADPAFVLNMSDLDIGGLLEIDQDKGEVIVALSAVFLIKAGFEEENNLFYVMTNSRGFTAEQTTKAHHEIAAVVDQVAKETGREYIFISCRSGLSLPPSRGQSALSRSSSWVFSCTDRSCAVTGPAETLVPCSADDLRAWDI